MEAGRGSAAAAGEFRLSLSGTSADGTAMVRGPERDHTCRNLHTAVENCSSNALSRCPKWNKTKSGCLRTMATEHFSNGSQVNPGVVIIS